MKRFGFAIFVTIVCLLICGCQKKNVVSEKEKTEETIYPKLIWYQVGAKQEDSDLVIETVNEYLKKKLGITIDIEYFGWSDCEKKAQAVITSGEYYDLMFTSSWSVDFYNDVKKEAFLPLNELLDQYGKEIYEKIDTNFWSGATVDGKIYAVPNEKEIVNMPMWCFTKEYVDKYDIPYEEIHTVEDLEPWLKIISENEPDVVPLYLTKDFTPPFYMDDIIFPLGIEYGCDENELKIVNVFETDQMVNTLKTLRRFYQNGYINKDAAQVSDDSSVKRFVTKGDGQPYADRIWSRNLGYDVVTSEIMKTEITSNSARGSMTSVSRASRYPEKAVQLLNLINTDEYLRNLLNYGIEGLHYIKVEAAPEEYEAVKDIPDVYNIHIKYTARSNAYNVPYWVQGGLFNTYVTVDEPLDKWCKFRELNEEAKQGPSFGFDFDVNGYQHTINSINSVVKEFSGALYTGSADTDELLSMLIKKLESNGLSELKEEMQRQLDVNRQTLGAM